MYVLNQYGDVLIVVVVGPTVAVAVGLNVHGTWFIVVVMFALKLLL